MTTVKMHWGIRIPLRDGTKLSSILYEPKGHVSGPVVLTMTPYLAQTYHDRGMYFASHGFPFLSVDVRGRGNSEGVFRPFIQEARDGFDVVEWLARQPYCNGQVAMWGGSYAGSDQWAVAKELPPHLSTIVPVASAYPGVDFPLRGNIAKPYWMQWLTFVSGRAGQEKIFLDQSYWSGKFKEWLEAGTPFSELDVFFGNPSNTFREWTAHPQQGPYWDSYNPRPEDYQEIRLPVLTITGLYDVAQWGALTYYREHLLHASSAARGQHYLVIGPWDHPGTRDPQMKFCGLAAGPASLIDMNALHVEWYAWTLRGAPKPAFLKKNVAYYVMGQEEWRYADSLEAVTKRTEQFYLSASRNPIDVFHSGALTHARAGVCEPGMYIHDPRDTSLDALESTVDPASAVDQRMIHASLGNQLIYHSAPFAEAADICGFFQLSVWIAIDQADADFRASVYEISVDGASVLLASDSVRARYRESLREPKLIRTEQPLRYDFQRFAFTARKIGKGSRLRLVVGSINSIYTQKNYCSGGVVADEAMDDARRTTVKLFHDEAHPSALRVPYGV